MRLSRRGVFGALAASGLASQAVAAQGVTQDGDSVRTGPTDPTVATSHGTIRGYRSHGVAVFKGVPYAGAPTGAFRFRRAPPLAAWSEVRNAYGYGPICPHWGPPRDISQSEWSMLIPNGLPTPESEDCLRLNIWTPGLEVRAHRPVMVWLHAQGFGAGYSQEFLATEGETLARSQDVVVVSLNHRVGALGFMHLGDGESGNAGMLDIVDALKWLRRNVAAFGGDPGNVTVFGQSGGGFKTTVLLAMPEAQGLFHKAIVQSGSRLAVHTPHSAQALTAATYAELGLALGDVAGLRAAATPALLDAAQRAAEKIRLSSAPTVGFAAPAWYWQPVSGVESLPEQPCDPGAPALSAHVPLIVGSTRYELNPTIDAPTLEKIDWEGVAAKVRPDLGNRTPAALAAARATFPEIQPIEAWSMIASRHFRLSAVAHCERVARRGGAPVYNYVFCWGTSLFEGRPRAFHTSDVAFAFGNTDLCATLTGGGPRARALADVISPSWARFARTGSPNGAGLPAWPAYDPQSRATMLLDDRCRVAADFDGPLRSAIG